VSKRNALRALKQERRNDIALYVEAMVPDDALASRLARKAVKAAKVTHRRKVTVKP
jgi:hypothetical protein